MIHSNCAKSKSHGSCESTFWNTHRHFNMNRTFVLLVTVLLSALASVSAVARIAVLKELDTEVVRAHRDLQVTFTVYNLGDEAAHNVRVLDAYWPDSFVEVIGMRDFHFEKVQPNSNVTHTFIVRPIESGVFHIPAARVLYEEAADTAAVRSVSTAIGYVRVVDGQGSESKELHSFEWVVFGILSLAAVLLPFSVFQQTRNAYSAEFKSQ